jgi:hypothetical protein
MFEKLRYESVEISGQEPGCFLSQLSPLFNEKAIDQLSGAAQGLVGSFTRQSI